MEMESRGMSIRGEQQVGACIYAVTEGPSESGWDSSQFPKDAWRLRLDDGAISESQGY